VTSGRQRITIRTGQGMENVDTGLGIDWTGCELVERIPGKVSGRPIVRGTRILADTIVQDAELGSPLEEIHENYPDLSLAVIQQLISFAHRTARSVP
jgi:uncharacterized protein (DUF433 family)